MRHNVTFSFYSSISLSSYSRHNRSFLKVFSAAVVTAFRWVLKAYLKAVDPMTRWNELYILLFFDLCCLAYWYKQAVMLALKNGTSRFLVDIIFTSIGTFLSSPTVSKTSKSFRQLSCSNFLCRRILAVVLSDMGLQPPNRHQYSDYYDCCWFP